MLAPAHLVRSKSGSVAILAAIRLVYGHPKVLVRKATVRLGGLVTIVVCMMGQEFVVLAVVAWGAMTLALMYLSRPN